MLITHSSITCTHTTHRNSSTTMFQISSITTCLHSHHAGYSMAFDAFRLEEWHWRKATCKRRSISIKRFFSMSSTSMENGEKGLSIDGFSSRTSVIFSRHPSQTLLVLSPPAPKPHALVLTVTSFLSAVHSNLER